MKNFVKLFGFGLVFAAFVVLASCDLDEVIKKGGTLKVENENTSYSVTVTVTDTSLKEVASKTIGASRTEKISIKKDGVYGIAAKYTINGIPGLPATKCDPIVATFLGGNTVSVEVNIIP